MKTFWDFQNTEPGFQRSSTKVVVLQNALMQYNHSTRVVKSFKKYLMKAFVFNKVTSLLKFHFFSHITQIIWQVVQNSSIENHINIAASQDNYFLRILLNGCFSKIVVKIAHFKVACMVAF